CGARRRSRRWRSLRRSASTKATSTGSSIQRSTQLLIGFLTNEVRMLNERLLEALYVPVERRVLRRVVELARLYGSDEGETVEVPLTQEELAGLAGTSRATVNQVLRAEQEKGTVELRRGKTLVTDADALARRDG